MKKIPRVVEYVRCDIRLPMVKIKPMFGGVVAILSFVLRMSFIAMFAVFVWRAIEPKSQKLRVLRAAVLVFGLVAILMLLRLAGGYYG